VSCNTGESKHRALSWKSEETIGIVGGGKKKYKEKYRTGNSFAVLRERSKNKKQSQKEGEDKEVGGTICGPPPKTEKVGPKGKRRGKGGRRDSYRRGGETSQQLDGGGCWGGKIDVTESCQFEQRKQ